MAGWRSILMLNNDLWRIHFSSFSTLLNEMISLLFWNNRALPVSSNGRLFSYRCWIATLTAPLMEEGKLTLLCASRMVTPNLLAQWNSDPIRQRNLDRDGRRARSSTWGLGYLLLCVLIYSISSSMSCSGAPLMLFRRWRLLATKSFSFYLFPQLNQWVFKITANKTSHSKPLGSLITYGFVRSFDCLRSHQVVTSLKAQDAAPHTVSIAPNTGAWETQILDKYFWMNIPPCSKCGVQISGIRVTHTHLRNRFLTPRNVESETWVGAQQSVL